MDLKQLRALLMIAETGSVTRAADMLHIVQPAVSRQLRLLEEDIGVPLFERGRHGMTLTDEGQILSEYARRALHELDRARAEIQIAPGNIQGVVTIGLLPSTSDLLASTLVTAVGERYPAIQLRISVGYAGHLQNWLESGEVDVALLYDPKPSPALQIQPLLEEQLWVVGRPSDGLSVDQPISLAELAGKPLVLPSSPHGIRSLVEHACAVANVTLSIVAETNALNVQKGLVRGGHGLTILPSIAVADDLTNGLFSAAPLSDTELQRKIVLALPSTRRIATSVRCVVDTLLEEMKSAAGKGSWSAARWIAD